MRFGRVLPILFCASSLAIVERARPADLSDVVPITAEQLRTVVGKATNQVVLVHFWATWCRPCRESFPALVRLAKAYPPSLLRIILVSADAEQDMPAVVKYLAQQGVQEPSYLALRLNDDFIKSVSAEWSGALPASFFFVPGQGLVKWWEGAHAYEQYADTVERLVQKKGGLLR